MRDALIQDVNSATHSHPGLRIERLARFDRATGKIRDADKTDFINSVCQIAVPDVYRELAYTRWEKEVSATCWTAVVAANRRVLLGLGNHSPLENGLSLHHTYGVPFIPGSALKGLLNHWLAERLGTEEPNWKGVVYGSGPREPPGAYHAALFGRPEISLKSEGAQGCVVFQDALYVPGSAPDDKPLVADVLTPHQVSYYAGKGTPDDWTNPEPHAFLSVRPGVRFLIALGGPSAWARLALKHLLDALGERGVGAKTAAGYGRMAGGKMQPPARFNDSEKLTADHRQAVENGHKERQEELASAQREQHERRRVEEAKEERRLAQIRKEEAARNVALAMSDANMAIPLLSQPADRQAALSTLIRAITKGADMTELTPVLRKAVLADVAYWQKWTITAQESPLRTAIASVLPAPPTAAASTPSPAREGVAWRERNEHGQQVLRIHLEGEKNPMDGLVKKKTGLTDAMWSAIPDGPPSSLRVSVTLGSSGKISQIEILQG